MINKNSIIEISDSIEKYKQKIFWKSVELKKIYDRFYKKIGKYAIYILNEYKLMGAYSINKFLYDRKQFFKNYKKSLFSIIDKIFSDRKTIDLDTLKSELINNVYYTFYKIIKSIIEIDNIFLKSPKMTEDCYVYRGINFKDKELEENMLNKLRKLKKGDTFSFENFLSTSLLNHTAHNFLKSYFTKTKEARCCLFKIKINKDTRVIYLDSNLTGFQFLKIKYTNGDENDNSNNIYDFLSEYEVLLPRASLLKYINSYTISGKIPNKCTIHNIDKTEITDTMVYEFEMVGVDTNREKFNLKDFVDTKSIKKVFKNFNHINFSISKYDLYNFSKKKNFKELLKKYEKKSIIKINSMIADVRL